MQYFGGKARIAKDIVSVLNGYRKPNQLFVEPFCGGINITCLMGDNVIANDKNFELIEMYKAIQNGWQPPENVTEEDYENAKTTDDYKLKAFIGIGCSYSGKWFGGYARGQKGRNYAKNAKNSLKSKFKTIGKVEFVSKGYEQYWHICSGGFTHVVKKIIHNDCYTTFAIKLDDDLKDIEGNNIIVVREFDLKFLERIEVKAKPVSERAYLNAKKVIERYELQNLKREN